VEEERPVVFKRRSREQAVTVDFADLICDFLHERKMHIRALRSEIERAARSGGGEVDVTEEWRGELVDVLDLIEQSPHQTADGRALRKLLHEPILSTEV
jgi:hypothetical protein